MGWGGTWEGGSEGRGHGCTYGWFLFMFDRKQQNPVKQLSFNGKILKRLKNSKTKNIYISKEKKNSIFRKNLKQLPSGYKSASKCRGYGAEPWPRNIPHAAGQRSLCSTTTEPVCCNYWRLEPCFTEKATAMRSPCSTPRGSLHTATKIFKMFKISGTKITQSQIGPRPHISKEDISMGKSQMKDTQHQ